MSQLIRRAVLPAELATSQATQDTATSAANTAQDALLSANAGSSRIGYLPAGSGAVATTVQAMLRRVVWLEDFGGAGDGATDNTLAFGRAFAALPNGGVVRVGIGNYRYSAINVPAGIVIEGLHQYATTLATTNATGNAITLAVSAGVRKCKLSSTVARTNGSTVTIQANAGTVDEVDFDTYYIAVTVGTLGQPVIVGARLSNLKLRSPCIVAGGGGIDLVSWSNPTLENIIGAGPTTGNQADFGIRIMSGDTCFISNCNITLHGCALLVVPPTNYTCYSLQIDNSVFDSGKTNASGGAVSSAQISPTGGNVLDTKISNTWFGLSGTKSGLTVDSSGGGTVDGLSAVGCEFPGNGDCGLLVVGTNVKNWSVTGGWAAGNANSGLRAAGATTDFSITGFRAGNVSGRGANNVGITIDAGASDRYTIVGNNLNGNTSSGLVDGATGAAARVVDNIGFNPAPTTPLVGASPWTYTASKHYPESIYVRGGTVSVINVASNTVHTSTDKSLRLEAGQSMVITYSAAPTVVSVPSS